MSASIFISYASQDAKVANTLCKALESRGFKCWIASRDIAPGENFQIAIVRAIRGAKIMLLVFTGNSNNSEEMAKELALASQSKLMVVPLRIDDVKPNDAFSYEFATRQWIDFFIDWESAIEQLAQRLAAALGVEATPVLTPVAGAPVEAPPPAPAPPPVVQPAPTPQAVMTALATPGVVEAAAQAQPAPESFDPGPSSFAPAPKRGAPVALFVALGVLAVALIGGAAVLLPSFLAKKPAPAAATNAVNTIAPAPVVAVAPTSGYMPPAAPGPVAMGAPAVPGPAAAPAPSTPVTPTAGGATSGPPAEDIDVDPDTQGAQARHERAGAHPRRGGGEGRSDSGPVEVPF